MAPLTMPLYRQKLPQDLMTPILGPLITVDNWERHVRGYNNLLADARDNMARFGRHYDRCCKYSASWLQHKMRCPNHGAPSDAPDQPAHPARCAEAERRRTLARRHKRQGEIYEQAYVAFGHRADALWELLDRAVEASRAAVQALADVEHAFEDAKLRQDPVRLPATEQEVIDTSHDLRSPKLSDIDTPLHTDDEVDTAYVVPDDGFMTD